MKNFCLVMLASLLLTVSHALVCMKRKLELPIPVPTKRRKVEVESQKVPLFTEFKRDFVEAEKQMLTSKESLLDAPIKRDLFFDVIKKGDFELFRAYPKSPPILKS